jgi:hypothetical protein
VSASPSKGPCWSTASFGETADASPKELSTLSEHLAVCRAHSPRLFALHCAVDTARDFVAARFVTTLVVAVLLAGLGSMVW